MKLDFRQRLLATTLLATAGLIATPAFAQDCAQPTVLTEPAAQPRAAPPAGPVEANRRRPPRRRASRSTSAGHHRHRHAHSAANLESAAPVTVVSDQDLKLSGTTRVEDLLNSLPSVGASQASGVSTARPAPPKSTFAISARSAPWCWSTAAAWSPGDPNSTTQAADLNFIPSSLDQARRSADRRRLVGVRCGRGRRRRQLHHGYQLRRYPVRRPDTASTSTTTTAPASAPASTRLRRARSADQ